MSTLAKQNFWFITGSQFLYGEEALKQVADNATVMVDELNKDELIVSNIVMKGVVKTNSEFTELVLDANRDETCAGVIVWCHTFSPSKMWINGLTHLQKPYCHVHTQFNRNIPNEEIDMDFMNLNQAAHADREHGFIAARLRMARKVIVGYWKDQPLREKLGDWMRVAYGYKVSQNLRVMRFGDNMREVAVTEGDKVEAQIKLGWQVNTWAVGDLALEIAAVTQDEEDKMFESYKAKYDIKSDNVDAIRYQAREEVAMRKFFMREQIGAFSNNFQDLHGMKQLPGLATQNLMASGYGYAGEGDRKIAALTHIMKQMGDGKDGGTSFIEDYTYDLEVGNELALGSHMLEVCPSISADKPRIEVHPLGIGDREDPARLVFEGKAGSAILASIVDMGGRFRLIIQDVDVVKPILDMPNLPVARVMWKPAPDLYTGCECWILAGGAHHSVISYQVSAQQMIDWADLMDIEYVYIDKDTDPVKLKTELKLADLVYKLK